MHAKGATRKKWLFLKEQEGRSSRTEKGKRK